MQEVSASAGEKLQRDFVSHGSFEDVRKNPNGNPSAVAGIRLAELRAGRRWPLDSSKYTICVWCGNGVKIEERPQCSRCHRTPEYAQ